MLEISTDIPVAYADIKENDTTNGKGICVSFWAQGCPHHCFNCHNPETWSFMGGKRDTAENILKKILIAIDKNGIKRNFSILGGEPLCYENIFLVGYLIDNVRIMFPDITIYLWTGYEKQHFNLAQQNIANKVDVLIDGPYIDSLRDITLDLRGSSNQTISYMRKGEKHE